MQTTKKVLSVLLAVLMLALSVPFVSFAETSMVSLPVPASWP